MTNPSRPDAGARLIPLVSALSATRSRVRGGLKRLVRRWARSVPLFGIVGVVAESEDERAQRLLADTFGTALRRSDLPGGALSSWGATGLPDHGAPVAASALSGHFFGATPRRMLGPVEYLVVWHLQRTQRTALSAEGFQAALARMITMLNRSEDARLLYPQKLAADAQNELEGAYTRATRERPRRDRRGLGRRRIPGARGRGRGLAPATTAHGWCCATCDRSACRLQAPAARDASCLPGRDAMPMPPILRSLLASMALAGLLAACRPVAPAADGRQPATSAGPHSRCRR